MSCKKVIIDVDTGVDDAQALMIALSHRPEIDILAVTCVNGNTNVDQVCLNTLAVLKVCGDEKVPVYKGAHSPLLGQVVDGIYHHGSDGMGGVAHTMSPDITFLQTDHAVYALVRLARQHKGDITLVALAPLTNIAMALRMDKDFCNNLKEVIIMGGNIEGRGNVTTCAEFNFVCDPESASITISELRCPIKLLAWEPCLSHGFDWDWLDNIHAVDTAKSNFHAQMIAFSNKKKREFMKMPHYYSCDPMAMVVALYPSSVLVSRHVYCTVELKGELTRGQLVVDWNGVLKKPTNVEIVQKVDMQTVKKCYEKMLM